MSSEDDSNVVRRRFTLGECLDDQLQTFADEHYQGNKSLFLRSAIRDHMRTLDGDDQITLREILDQICQHREDFEELIHSLESNTRSQHARQADLNGKETENLPDEEHSANVAQTVHRCLEAADSQSLTISEIVSRVNEESYEIKPALERLLKKDWVVAEHQGDSIQYRIRGPT